MLRHACTGRAVGPTPPSLRSHDDSTTSTCQHGRWTVHAHRALLHLTFAQQRVATTRQPHSVSSCFPTRTCAVAARLYSLFRDGPGSVYRRRHSHLTAAADSDSETLHRPPAGSARSSPSHQEHRDANDASTPSLKHA